MMRSLSCLLGDDKCSNEPTEVELSFFSFSYVLYSTNHNSFVMLWSVVC